MNQIEAVPYDAIVDIQISGSFYKRIQALTLYLMNTKDKEEVGTEIEKMRAAEQLSSFGYNLECLFILINEIEDKYKLQGLTKLVDTTQETP